MTASKERFVMMRLFGEFVDATVYHTGGTAHWVVVESVATGRLLWKRKFQRAARDRATVTARMQFDSFERAIRGGQYDEARVFGK